MSSVEALSCQELVELVTDYLEDALSAQDRERFEAHLAECGNCLIYLDQMRVTVGLLGRLPAESLSPQAERTLLEAFGTWKTADSGAK